MLHDEAYLPSPQLALYTSGVCGGVLNDMEEEEMSIDLGEIKVSKICSDKKYGTWWAIGTHNQYLEIRVTKAGKIKPFSVKKEKHPYFTKERL